MTTFDDRKDSFENKFKHDQELQFKITARRNKLLGLWAAELMGIQGSEAETYAKKIAVADLQTSGEQDIIETLLTDLGARNVPIDERHLRKKLLELQDKASQQVRSETA